MPSLLQDLRYALRNLQRAPGFAIVTVLTLALGIGANTAIFSLVNGVILRPLGYPTPGQLMFLTTRFPNMGFDQFWVSPPEYLEFRDMNQSFAVVGAFSTTETNLAAIDRPRRVQTAQVNGELLEALGTPPLAGRWFRRDETIVNGPPIVILSDEIWRSAFAGRADIVGQAVDVGGVKREVVGIMPAGFDVMDHKIELWLPLQLNPANRQNRSNHFLYTIGRLKSGVSMAAAQAELSELVATWGERAGVKQHVFNPQNHAMQMEPVQEEIVGSARRAIWVLQAAVGFVLLIACANLANLLLARAETRHREFAVRTALGASRRRLLGQFLTEGTMLSLFGGATGLALAWLGVGALMRMYPDSLPRAVDVTVDPAVLTFTLAITLVTGVVFGLAPLLHVRAASLSQALKEGGARGSTGARHHVRRALVMAEVALAVVLVVGAGLMLRTVLNLMKVDAGFNRSQLVTFALDLPTPNYPTFDDVSAFYRRMLADLSSVPGVQRAAAMSGLPPQRQVDANDTDIDNYTAPKEGPFENVDYWNFVTADYFEAMGIPLTDGRAFQATDANGGLVAVVNQRLVDTFWKGQNPIGQRLKPCCGDKVPWMTVVGVAKDVKQGGVDQKTGTELYFLIDQLPTIFAGSQGIGSLGSLNIVLRTTLPVESIRQTIETRVRAADATLPVIRFRAMDEVFAQSLSRPRLLANLLAAFAGLALLLAAVGTYGVLSYMVTERRREIGVRIALGAQQSHVLGLVMGQGLALTSMGLLAGLAGAFALTQLMASLLFGVEPSDPATLVGVILCITIVAALACYVPAYRASRVDPIVVLREE